MQKVKVFLTGCDDETIIDVELTDEQIAGVAKVASLSIEAAEYGCQPKMSVEID